MEGEKWGKNEVRVGVRGGVVEKVSSSKEGGVSSALTTILKGYETLFRSTLFNNKLLRVQN